jgi:peptidoglycan/LPS O-acetylase OafA/YrhL
MKKEFKINNFDLLRIITAIMVLTNHSLAHLKLDIPWWYVPFQEFPRVPMFFVMSGYLLSASFERNSQLKSYFRNRFSRIYPGLWGCLFLTIISFAVLAGVNFIRIESLPWICTQMLGLIYTPEFLNNFGYGSYNGSLWTIVVELQFYIALPVIYFLLQFYRGKFLKWNNINVFFYILFIFSFLLSFAVNHFTDNGQFAESGIEKLVRYSLLTHMYIFVAGILLQRLNIYRLKIIYGKGVFWIIAYLAFIYLLPNSLLMKMMSVLLLAVCTVSVAYTAPGFATKYLKNNDLSYGVYMYHGMILCILVEFHIIGSYYHYALVFAITILLAYLSYHLIERPVMEKLKKKKVTRQIISKQALLSSNRPTHPKVENQIL